MDYILTLLTNLVTNLATWFIQQRKIENLKAKFEEKRIQIEEGNLQLAKNKQVVEMQEKRNKLYADQLQLYYDFTVLVQQGDTMASFDLQEKRRQIERKYQEIETVGQIISELTGVKYIKEGFPPLPPSNLRVQ